MKLRPYQEKAIERIRSSFRKGFTRVCLQLPTGSGKTVIAAFMIKGALAKGHKVMFVVHRRELITQTVDKLRQAGVKESDVDVVMVQTYSRRLDKTPSLIIFDECHHCVANTYKKILEKHSDALVVGLTATPQRLDGKGLGEIFQDLVIGLSVQELIDLKALSNYKIIAPPSDLDLNQVHKQAGDYNQKELDQALDQSCVFGDAITHYKKHLDGKKAIVFCVNIRHSQRVCGLFKAAGIEAAHIDGNYRQEERDQIIDSFKNGKTKVLVNCSLISEGFDVPDCDGVIMLRPTLSLILYLQSVGRALRPGHNKKAIVIDHVRNWERHGLPRDEREWNLFGKASIEKNEAHVRISQCPVCFTVLESKSSLICETCGHSFVKERKEREDKLRQIECELVEVDEDANRLTGKQINQMAWQCKTFEELKKLGKKLGYADGWAWHRWEARKNKKKVLV